MRFLFRTFVVLCVLIAAACSASRGPSDGSEGQGNGGGGNSGGSLGMGASGGTATGGTVGIGGGPPTVVLPEASNWVVFTPGGSTGFDDREVSVQQAPSPHAESATLSTTDGLAITLAPGGAISGVSLNGSAVEDKARAFMGGFFLQDVRESSDWLHPGGTVEGYDDALEQQATLSEMGLTFTATYQSASDRINVHAEVTDTTGEDRALTVYFALPLAMQGWTFGQDVRTEREVTGAQEFSVLSEEWDIGAIGKIAWYPWGTVSGPAGGVVLAHSLAEPRVTRVVANPVTQQLYIAFDVGLSSLTERFPSQAWIDFTLYSTTPGWGFRAATQGYYDRFPEAFERRIPPENEGIWLPFTSPAEVPNPDDFGFAIHELAFLNQVPDGDAASVYSLRYLAEPWSHWFGINTPGVDPSDPADYDAVIEALEDVYENGTPEERRKVEATLSSAAFDTQGRYHFKGYAPGEVPWCPGTSGCALFALNADPAVSDATYPLNKANLEWSEGQDDYDEYPSLDGEYIDNIQFAAFRLFLDARAAHWATTSQPLSFSGEEHALGIPNLFSTATYLHWLGEQVHGQGKLFMGNTMLEGLPWGADVLDYMGVETNWLNEGGLVVPPPDSSLSYRRALSGKKPYGYLMNTNFEAIGQNGGVERYFQTALFYGIYPSFYSPNAFGDPYWQDAAFYERDRPLYVKYIPLIRAINIAGWEPITLAHTSDASIFIERFGQYPDLYFTLRSTSTSATDVTITLDPALNLPTEEVPVESIVTDALGTTIAPGMVRTFTVNLGAESVEVVRIGE